MGTKLKYALTFVFLMLSVLVFSVASVMAAAKVTVKNSVFEDCGIFSIGLDSHFAGQALFRQRR